MRIVFTLVCCLFLSTPATRAQITWSNYIHFDDASYADVLLVDTVNFRHNVWQIGKPHKPVFSSAYSPRNAIVTDTVNPFPLADTSVFYLKIPCYMQTMGIWWPVNILQFQHRLHIDTGIKVLIELTSDTLHDWVSIQRDTLPYKFELQHPINLDSSTSGWELVTLIKPVWLGWPRRIYDTMLFRFTVISDSSTSHKDGWMIDDIWINYYVESVPLLNNPSLISLYPNPSHGSIYIHNPKPTNEAKVRVYDMQGREVYSSGAPANGMLNLQLPNGAYLLRYSTEEEYCTKQIIIAK